MLPCVVALAGDPSRRVRRTVKWDVSGGRPQAMPAPAPVHGCSPRLLRSGVSIAPALEASEQEVDQQRDSVIALI
jgi:hypothetical protein